MKLFKCLLPILLVFAQFNIAQEVAHPSLLNAMSNVIGITAEGGATFGITDYSTKINYSVKASLEYYIPSNSMGNIGLRVFGQTGFISGKNTPPASGNPTDAFSTKIDLLGGQLMYILSIHDVVYPWVALGLSNVWFNPKNANGNELPNNSAGTYTKYMFAFNGDVGVRIMASKNMSLNLTGGVIVGKSDYLDDFKIGTSNDMLYTLNAGLSYYFNRVQDSDGDGVPDSKDMCPNTPLGVKVDEFGCPLDSDRDGVPDYLDKCPNTPAGVKVDASGCPLDSDGDGVPDYLDKCPNTPAGVQVDADGCPIKKETVVIVQPPEIESLVLSGDANFEFNKATLLPNAYPILDSLVGTMKKHIEYKWEVGGYTDGVGSVNYNLGLSQRRAQAVVDYLVTKGVNSNNLKVVGYGKSNPIATNDTPEGRAMNRRVEIKVLSKNNQ